MKREMQRLFMLLLCFFLTGSDIFDLGLDSGLVTGQPCQAPCWQNLTPGQSNKLDLNQYLKQLDSSWTIEPPLSMSTVNDCTVVNAEKLSFGSANSIRLVEFYVLNERLTKIKSYPSGVLLPSLVQIINQIGDPEYYRAVLAIGPDGQLYSVELYYPQKGVTIEVFANDWDIGQINQSMPIKSITYNASGNLLEFMENSNPCQLGDGIDNVMISKSEMELIFPWKGFGKVDYAIWNSGIYSITRH